jgi:PAS domain S-box-containing protein
MNDEDEGRAPGRGAGAEAAALDPSAVLGAVPAPILVFDEAGAVRSSNRAAEALTGQSAAALAAAGLSGLFEPGDARMEALLGACARDGGFEGELEVLGAADERVPVEVVATAVGAGSGARGFVAVLHDLRPRREAERRLRDRARHQAFVAGLAERALAGASLDASLAEAAEGLARALEVSGVVVWECAEHGHAVVARAVWGLDSPGASELFAAESGSFPAFVLARERPVVVPDFRAETRFVRDGFHSRPAVVSGAGAVVSGPRSPFGVLAVYAQGHRGFTVQDVQLLQSTAGLLGTLFERAASERERAELQAHIRRTERLELVGRMASGFAHDFNNLMAVVLSTTGAVLAELSPTDPHREDISEIEAAARRAAALTGDLLLLGRGDGGNPRWVRIDEVVHGVGRILERAVGARATLTLDVAPVAWLVRADPGRVEQVLMNLVVNARDAAPAQGGTITVSVRARRQEATGAPEVVIAVADNGRGIPDAARPHLFEPFFTTKPAGQGTGLGLATVMAIATGAGGRVLALDRDGGGTVMEVALPAAEAAPGGADTDATAPLGPVLGSGASVLLVDDDPAVRRAVRRLVEQRGYAVVEASDGVEALERLAAPGASFALILSDVSMPNMGGHELAAQVRRRGIQTPIALMSGFETADAGSLDCAVLRKPLSDDSLGAVLCERPDASSGALT